MKWKYDKKFKEWYWFPEGDRLEHFTIKSDSSYAEKKYKLTSGYFKTIGRFKKLSSAKKVAELLING